MQPQHLQQMQLQPQQPQHPQQMQFQPQQMQLQPQQQQHLQQMQLQPQQPQHLQQIQFQPQQMQLQPQQQQHPQQTQFQPQQMQLQPQQMQFQPQEQQHPEQTQFQQQQQQHSQQTQLQPQQMQFQQQQQQHSQQTQLQPQQTQLQPQQMQFQQQQQTPAQPGVTLVIQNPAAKVYKLKGPGLTQMKRLSITQVVMGSLCILFGIILIPLEAKVYGFGLSFVGYGIWNGIYFIIVGGIGLAAVKRNTKCWVTAAMVLNIICSAAFFVPMLSLSAVSLKAFQVSTAFSSLLLIISIAEFVITIWSAALCCGAVCSCCCCFSASQRNVEAPQTQQTYVIYPGAAPTYQVNVDGKQVTMSGVVTAALTLPNEQTLEESDAQPQCPPAYNANTQSTSYQNQSYEQPKGDLNCL